MTREEAIKTIEVVFKSKETYKYYDSVTHQALNMAIEALKAEPKCVAQIKVDTEEVVRRIKEEYDITDGWIPCSERLPSNDGCVLVTIDDGIEFGKYEDGSWSIWVCEHWDKWEAKGIIAWMPLPKPYREDGEA